MPPETAEQTGQQPSPDPWIAAPRDPHLGDGCVHVWRADLASVADPLVELLSEEEYARAARFARKPDGRLWARGRGVLRALLGSYLGIEPRTVAFAKGTDGKPLIERGRAPAGDTSPHEPRRDLSFNMSHSGVTALYAVGTLGSVGVDVELGGRARDTVALAARAFGAGTAERLRRLEPARRERDFLRMWVRHEAALKCLGTGLGVNAEARPQRELWIAELDMGPQAAGALALMAAPRELRCWIWPAGATPFASDEGRSSR